MDVTKLCKKTKAYLDKIDACFTSSSEKKKMKTELINIVKSLNTN